VYVVGVSNEVEFRPVALGRTVDHMQVIKQGVKAGDQVIVQGQQKVRPGIEVEPVATVVASPTTYVPPVSQTSS
jgi:multidrug efflux system membrane fusion protein